MARVLDVGCDRVVSIAEFVEQVETQVDLRDLDSVAAAAPLLRGLANDRRLVVDRLNRQVEHLFRRDTVASAQVLYLGEGHDFYLRANIWPSQHELDSGRMSRNAFAYHLAHDHNYSFMTVGYHGPGYRTALYDYDHDRVSGYIGETVDLRYVGEQHFGMGMVMLYEASRDVHTQHPPEALSVTLNWMIATPEVRLRDQFFFDLERRQLIDYPLELDGSRRISVLRMAGDIGNPDTLQLLHDLALTHPCRRTRLAACTSFARLAPASEARALWQRACDDPEPMVALAARRQLQEPVDAVTSID